MKKLIKDNMMNILNGMSIAIIISLMPEAILGGLLKALHVTNVTGMLSLSTSMMCAIIGLCIAHNYKLDTISSGSLAIATFLAGGAMKGITPEGIIQVKGAGDILNCMIGAVIAVAIILNLKDRLKAYKLIILPAVTIMVTGVITSLTAAPVSLVTVGLGNMIQEFTTMQPYIMSILIAATFAVLIVSPMSTVAVALLISLSMNGSAAANVGVVAMAVTMAILAYKENGLATSIAHFMGSPKIQLANVMQNPKIMIPGIISAIICSVLVPYFNIQGTPNTAGFGISGLLGPLGHLNTVGFSTHNIIIVTIVFVIVPAIVSLASSILFRDKLHVVSSEQFKLNID